jgi:hypothetical protein
MVILGLRDWICRIGLIFDFHIYIREEDFWSPYMEILFNGEKSIVPWNLFFEI